MILQVPPQHCPLQGLPNEEAVDKIEGESNKLLDERDGTEEAPFLASQSQI